MKRLKVYNDLWGKITDTAGTAISGVLVKLKNVGQTATIGVDGSFTLTTVSQNSVF